MNTKKDVITDYMLQTDADYYLIETAIGDNRYALVIHLLTNPWFKKNTTESEKAVLQDYSNLMRNFRSLSNPHMEKSNLSDDYLKSKLSDLFPKVWKIRKRLLLLDSSVKNEKD
ncbi:hypothetical protein V2V46_07690 [Streptococcus agalactiae]